MKSFAQKEVWDNIANSWQEFRAKPIPEVSEFLKEKKGKVLDLCCGSGRNFKRIDGVIYGVDFSKNMLKYAKEFADKEGIKVIIKESKAEKLPFEDDFFDSAVYIASLHCLPSKEERKNSLEELYRTLKKNSDALVTVWDKNQEKFKEGPKENMIPWEIKGKEKFERYYYLYEKNELTDLLKEVGFSIIKVYEKENENLNYSTRKRYSDKNIVVIIKK